MFFRVGHIHKKISAAVAVAWGNITGTLSAQTDLQAALDAKAATAHNHSAADVTSGTLVLARGGTGASLVDPNADRIVFWDDSAGAVTFLTAGTNLTITGTTIDATDAPHPDPHLLGVGSASAPSYSFDTHSGTGMYYVSTDRVAFACGGTQVFSVGISGGVSAVFNAGLNDLSFNGKLNSSGNGGSVSFLGGTSTNAGSHGGNISFSGGLGSSGGSAIDGGSASITGGAGSGGGGNGGSVLLTAGALGGGGVSGHIELRDSAGSHIVKVNGTSKHLSHGGTAPTITANGGTSPSIVGRDEAFIVTIGTGGTDTSFEVTFNKAFANAPASNAQSDTDIVAFKVVTTTTKVTVTATAPFTAGSKVHVITRGWE